jgi:hypothetical protein
MSIINKNFKTLIENNTRKEFESKYDLRTYYDYDTEDVSLFHTGNVEVAVVCPYKKDCSEIECDCMKCWEDAIKQAKFKNE